MVLFPTQQLFSVYEGKVFLIDSKGCNLPTIDVVQQYFHPLHERRKPIIIKVKDSQSQSYTHEKGGDDLRNISDIIEQHLKSIITESPNGSIEIQRSELADLFQCVPSQINYVINTRFTVQKGYIVESKRGGGGYIRIRKVQIVSKARLQELLTEELIGESITQSVGNAIIERLLEDGLLSQREAALMKIATSRNVLMIEPNLRDKLRAAMLKQMIAVILLK